MSETKGEATSQKTGFADESALENFLALPVEARLKLILDRSFDSWCAHANDGVSLVYDHATQMIAKIVKQILAVEETDSFANFDIFSTRMVLSIETGYDAYNPDAGAFRRESSHSDASLFMIETAVRAMSSDDAPFGPGYLVPQDPGQASQLKIQFPRVFSAQFRFWAEDHIQFSSRLAGLHTQMAEFPQVIVVEKSLSVSLRKTNRFRLKRKVLDFVETPVRAIAIGQDW